MWCHWHQYQHHLIPMASSMAPLHLFSQDNQNDVQHWQWCWHHMMPREPKSLSSLGQDNWSEVQHDFLFGYLMPLALASVSHHANCILSGSIASLIEKTCNIIFCCMMPLALLFLSFDAIALLLASSGLDTTINGTNAFLMSRQFKRGATWLCGNVGHLHWFQCHMVPIGLSMAPLHS